MSFSERQHLYVEIPEVPIRLSWERESLDAPLLSKNRFARMESQIINIVRGELQDDTELFTNIQKLLNQYGIPNEQRSDVFEHCRRNSGAIIVVLELLLSAIKSMSESSSSPEVSEKYESATKRIMSSSNDVFVKGGLTLRIIQLESKLFFLRMKKSDESLITLLSTSNGDSNLRLSWALGYLLKVEPDYKEALNHSVYAIEKALESCVHERKDLGAILEIMETRKHSFSLANMNSAKTGSSLILYAPLRTAYDSFLHISKKQDTVFSEEELAAVWAIFYTALWISQLSNANLIEFKI